jgi:hypothetical protein
MHIDNLEALNFINSKLGVGIVTIEEKRNITSLVVQDFIEIRDVICPIFIKFSLLTTIASRSASTTVLVRNQRGGQWVKD